jgi:hypothetical protein
MVTETKSAIAELLAKHPVLLAKVVNDLQLALVHPSGNGNQEKTECVENSLGFQSFKAHYRQYEAMVEPSQTHTDPLFGPYGVNSRFATPRIRSRFRWASRAAFCLLL